MKKTTYALAIAALLASSASTLAADTKVGLLMDITGPIASFIPPLQNAANLAVQHVNENGGLLDGQAVPVYGDTTGSSQGAVDAAGKLIKSFGKGDGQKVATNTSHGLKVDLRYGEPRLLVCDRENRRLFHTDLDGNWIGEYATNLRRPCSVSIHGDFCAVAELEARVTIIDKAGTPVSFLGDNPNKGQWAKFPIPPNEMSLGIFTAPHGLSFDKDGNLYVEDWNQTGRVTKLVKIH